MDKEPMSLKDLMDSIQQQWPNTPETNEDDQSFDDLFGIPATQEPPAIPDPDVVIADTLQKLEPFHLIPEQQQIIREFLTLQLQTKQVQFEQPEAQKAYYNLLVSGEEPEHIRRFAKILQDALGILRPHSLLTTEQELLHALESSARRSGRTPIPENVQFILIDQCQDAPRISMDGGAAARDASKKAVAQYNALWDYVLQHIRANPATILIVGCTPDVYRNTLLPFRKLSGHICNHPIHLPPRTEEELLADCLMELHNSSFTIADGFDAQLTQYFHNTYRASDLEGEAFISDLISQVYSRYYCRKQNDRVLTPACVPETDPLLQSVESVLGQLGGLIGLEAVKEEFQSIYKMQVAGLNDSEHARYHMLFSGNPGTGKTTVARMAANLFFRMGIIKTNKLVVVKPCDLVSEWVGGTGMKAMEVIRRAYNGVLFIDEAYGIATMDRGEELLNVLLQEMENHPDKLVVIFAGYKEEMRELLKSNPGLSSRISRQIEFEDYTLQELVEIFLLMCKKDGFSLDPSARDELEDCISARMTREFFGNARDIRNMLQDLKEAWSDSYYDAMTKYGTGNVQMEKIFLPEHFIQIMPPKKEVSIQDLVGLDTMKKKLEIFKQQALYQKFLKEKGFSGLTDFSMHMIFTGNPGTGKTTVAKLIADDLYSIGMLKTNRLVVAERKDLVSVYGETAKKTTDMIRKAVGGVLFVDEAYALADSHRGGLGKECMEVFLTAMEEHKADTVFIFAGYVEEMQEFLMMNPGIQSRIGYTFHFDDYSPQELTRIYGEKMQKTGFQVSEDAMQRVLEIMEYFQDVKHFGNGRFVNHVMHQTISQRAARDFTKDYRSIQSCDIPTIKTLIETAPNNIHLYDPAEITAAEQRRTAIHEAGHAIVMVGTDPTNIPETLSIRSHAGSLGRVRLPASQLNQTEQDLLNHIAILLGSKNAETLLLGCHSTGCSGDYARAKRVAEDMVEKFAMTTFGSTAAEILQAADQLSLQIITANRDQILPVAEALLDEKELTGEAFIKLLNK